MAAKHSKMNKIGETADRQWQPLAEWNEASTVYSPSLPFHHQESKRMGFKISSDFVVSIEEPAEFAKAMRQLPNSVNKCLCCERHVGRPPLEPPAVILIADESGKKPARSLLGDVRGVRIDQTKDSCHHDLALGHHGILRRPRYP